MAKCTVCGEEILTQVQFWSEKCKKAIVKGSSHMLSKNELTKLNAKRKT